MEVGDQKFISLNSDGFGTRAFFFFCIGLMSSSGWRLLVSPLSSSAIKSQDCEMVSRLARRFDNIQLPWCFVSESTKAPVKYLLYFLRAFGDSLGEPRGDAGRDLLPLRIIGSKPCGGLSESSCCVFSSGSTWNPLITLPDTIMLARLMMEEPHFAASPLKPSSTPLDFVFAAMGYTTRWAVAQSEKKISIRMSTFF